ncbi:hypothetical protein [Planktothricoides sp. SR001]
MTPEELDDIIEQWMNEKFDPKIYFDIKGFLQNLQTIRGQVMKDTE